MAASRELKLSIRHEGSQASVWSSVDAAQAKLSRSVGCDIRSAASPSSLPLAVENEVVRRKLSGYVMPFANCWPRSPRRSVLRLRSTGGSTAPTFTPHRNSSASSGPSCWRPPRWKALTEADSLGATCAVPTADEVSTWLRRSRRGRKTQHAVTPRVTLVVRENDGQVSFETMDADQANLCVHQNILAH